MISKQRPKKAPRELQYGPKTTQASFETAKESSEKTAPHVPKMIQLSHFEGAR